MTTLPPQTSSPNPLQSARLSFVGVGVMAEAMIAGLLRRQLVARTRIVGSHPRAARREELQTHYGIRMVESNREAVTHATTEQADGEALAASIVVLAVKPQRAAKIMGELRGAITPEQLIL